MQTYPIWPAVIAATISVKVLPLSIAWLIAAEAVEQLSGAPSGVVQGAAVSHWATQSVVPALGSPQLLHPALQSVHSSQKPESPESKLQKPPLPQPEAVLQGDGIDGTAGGGGGAEADVRRHDWYIVFEFLSLIPNSA